MTLFLTWSYFFKATSYPKLNLSIYKLAILNLSIWLNNEDKSKRNWYLIIKFESYPLAVFFVSLLSSKALISFTYLTISYILSRTELKTGCWLIFDAGILLFLSLWRHRERKSAICGDILFICWSLSWYWLLRTLFFIYFSVAAIK